MRMLPAALLAALPALSCGKPAPWGPAWTADPAALAALGDEVEVDAYRLRLPPGLRSMPPPASTPPGAQVSSWQGAPRADGTTPSLSVMIWTPAPEEAKESALEAALTAMVDGVKRRRTEFSRTSPERGTIDGRPFMRARWTGKEPARGIPMGGVAYLGLDGPRLLYFNTQDAEPHLEAALRLGEAGILSLRKRP